MEREIKFRVWDKINKKLDRNRTGFISDQGGFYVDSDPHGIDMSGQRRISMRPNQYEFAGQYTGLKDKNGKEIYEGDVITCFAVQRECYDEIEDGTKVTVSYYDGYFYPFGYNAGWRSEVGNIEVIGNIYENPELLKA